MPRGELTGIKGLENAGLSPQEDTNNWQPRVGFAFDVRGDARDVIRGGWGVYQDVGYTNSNVLFPAIDATGIGSGSIFNVDNADGIRNPDGSFYRVGQPISNIASQNQANPNALPLIGQWVDPRLQMPYTRQTAFGWSHQVNSSSSFNVDFVRNDGRDLNVRPRINTRPVGNPTAARRLAFLDLQPNAAGTRPAISAGKSEYTALIMGFKRRMSNGFDFSASYTLAEAKSTIGTAGDELNANLLQEAELLYDDPRVFGPTSRTDARHTVSVAMVWQAPWGINVSPIFLSRSALPVSITEGIDLNAQRREQRSARQGLCLRRRRQRAEGNRRLRDVELRSRRGAVADEPAPREVVPSAAARCASRPSARSSTCSTRPTRPGSARLASSARASSTRTSCSRPSTRGLPEPRAARRADRVPVYVLALHFWLYQELGVRS